MTGLMAGEISLVVSTYNRPDALRLVLESVRVQRLLPGEVLIADDGSGDETRVLIAEMATGFPVPLRHVWQDDHGFRVGAIRNKAIAISRLPYVVQIDGDIMVHRDFIRSHAQFARVGCWAQGSRSLLGKVCTERLLQGLTRTPGVFTRDVSHRWNAIYFPPLARLVQGPRDSLSRVRGAHFACWRGDLIRVNGYDEEMEGWGREDSELAARLIASGVQRRNIKYSAVAFHLWHPASDRSSLERNDEYFHRCLRERRTFARKGIDQHLQNQAAIISYPHSSTT